MTVRPHPTVRGFAIMVMLVVLLAASALFSAPAPHHDPGLVSAAAHHHTRHSPAVPHQQAGLLPTGTSHHPAGEGSSAACVGQHHSDQVAHEDGHRHGNHWTPRLTQRARVVVVAAVPHPRCEIVLPTPVSTAPGVVLSRLGVLRV